jgi:hypothetical protein
MTNRWVFTLVLWPNVRVLRALRKSGANLPILGSKDARAGPRGGVPKWVTFYGTEGGPARVCANPFLFSVRKVD